jgi:hypothetical protein
MAAVQGPNRYLGTQDRPRQADRQTKTTITPKIPGPPPIFVHGVQNHTEIIKRIQEIAEQEQYFTKSPANNILKINCETPETYKIGQRIQRTKYISPHLPTERRTRI